MHVSVLSWSAYGGGRARALLSLTNYLSANGIRVSVTTGTQSWPYHKLCEHHDIYPQVEWHTTDWKDNAHESIQTALERDNPDVVISWDGILNTKTREIDTPVVGYARTQNAVGLDEVWSPSKSVADEFGSQPVYPVWYINEPNPTANRPIDILIHGRKARDVVETLNPEYNIVLANRFSYPELRGIYRDTKLFLFPRPERFEPLGLMPIEAAAHGCNIAIPENSGVAEIYPGCAYEYPENHVGDVLIEHQDLSVPESPTDPIERIQRLA